MATSTIKNAAVETISSPLSSNPFSLNVIGRKYGKIVTIDCHGGANVNKGTSGGGWVDIGTIVATLRPNHTVEFWAGDYNASSYELSPSMYMRILGENGTLQLYVFGNKTSGLQPRFSITYLQTS